MNVRVLVVDDVADIRRLIGAIIAAHDQKIARSRPGLRPHGVVPSSSPKFRRGVGDFVTPVGGFVTTSGFRYARACCRASVTPGVGGFRYAVGFRYDSWLLLAYSCSRLTASPRSIRIGTEPFPWTSLPTARWSTSIRWCSVGGGW